MSLLTWDKVLKIILTILQVLTSCLNSLGVKPEVETDEDVSLS